MDALFPAILKNLPGADNMSAADQAEMRDFVSKTTETVFGALGNGGGGGGGAPPDLGGLMSSILGSVGNMSGGGSSNAHIREHVEVDFNDFFRESEHTVKYHVRVWDEAIHAIKKKKRKVTLKLPSGAPSNHVIVVSGQGHFDTRTQSYGDLFVQFHEKAGTSGLFTRSGQDLVIKCPPRNFEEDLVNFERFIAHPSGTRLKIVAQTHEPLGFAGRSEIRVPGFGFPRFEEKRPGNLVIDVSIDPKMYDFVDARFVYTGPQTTPTSLENTTTIRVQDAWISRKIQRDSPAVHPASVVDADGDPEGAVAEPEGADPEEEEGDEPEEGAASNVELD